MLHDLWAHPVRRADLRLVPRIGIHTLRGYSKVSQFSNSFFIEQYIRSFDVSMYLFILVQINQSPQNALKDRRKFILIEFALGYV